MRLRLRQSLRQHSRRELEQQYNPINLDYIFDEDDPLAPWLEERERPVLDANDTSWLDDGDGDGDDPLAGTSVTVPVRLRDNDDDDDDDDDDGDGHDGGGGGDDDDDDDGSGAPPPDFGWGDASGHSAGHDYFPTTGANTPPYDQYGSGRGSGVSGASSSAGGDRRRDKGKNIVEDTEHYDVGQIGGDMSSLYLHSHDYGHVHYPLPMPMPSQETQDSSASIDSSGYSMGYGNRYGDYEQLNMASQLATSLFGGNYGQYEQQSEQSEEYGCHQEPARKSFWW